MKHFLQTSERLRTVNGIEPELIDKPWSTDIAFLLSFGMKVRSIAYVMCQ